MENDNNEEKKKKKIIITIVIILLLIALHVTIFILTFDKNHKKCECNQNEIVKKENNNKEDDIQSSISQTQARFIYQNKDGKLLVHDNEYNRDYKTKLNYEYDTYDGVQVNRYLEGIQCVKNNNVYYYDIEREKLINLNYKYEHIGIQAFYNDKYISYQISNGKKDEDGRTLFNYFIMNVETEQIEKTFEDYFEVFSLKDDENYFLYMENHAIAGTTIEVYTQDFKTLIVKGVNQVDWIKKDNYIIKKENNKLYKYDNNGKKIGTIDTKGELITFNANIYLYKKNNTLYLNNYDTDNSDIKICDNFQDGDTVTFSLLSSYDSIGIDIYKKDGKEIVLSYNYNTKEIINNN